MGINNLGPEPLRQYKFNPHSINVELERRLQIKKNQKTTPKASKSNNYSTLRFQINSMIAFDVTMGAPATAVAQALHSFKLNPHCYNDSPLPAAFLQIVSQPYKRSDIDIHPLLYYLSGVFKVSIPDIIDELQAKSPYNLILLRLQSVEVKECQPKFAIYTRFSWLASVMGQEFLKRLYLLVDGDEVFFVILYVVVMCAMLYNTFSLPFQSNARLLEERLNQEEKAPNIIELETPVSSIEKANLQEDVCKDEPIKKDLSDEPIKDKVVNGLLLQIKVQAIKDEDTPTKVSPREAVKEEFSEKVKPRKNELPKEIIKADSPIEQETDSPIKNETEPPFEAKPEAIANNTQASIPSNLHGKPDSEQTLRSTPEANAETVAEVKSPVPSISAWKTYTDDENRDDIPTSHLRSLKFCKIWNPYGDTQEVNDEFAEDTKRYEKLFFNRFRGGKNIRALQTQSDIFKKHLTKFNKFMRKLNKEREELGEPNDYYNETDDDNEIDIEDESVHQQTNKVPNVVMSKANAVPKTKYASSKTSQQVNSIKNEFTNDNYDETFQKVKKEVWESKIRAKANAIHNKDSLLSSRKKENKIPESESDPNKKYLLDLFSKFTEAAKKIPESEFKPTSIVDAFMEFKERHEAELKTKSIKDSSRELKEDIKVMPEAEFKPKSIKDSSSKFSKDTKVLPESEFKPKPKSMKDSSSELKEDIKVMPEVESKPDSVKDLFSELDEDIKAIQLLSDPSKFNTIETSKKSTTFSNKSALGHQHKESGGTVNNRKDSPVEKVDKLPNAQLSATTKSIEVSNTESPDIKESTHSNVPETDPMVSLDSSSYTGVTDATDFLHHKQRLPGVDDDNKSSDSGSMLSLSGGLQEPTPGTIPSPNPEENMRNDRQKADEIKKPDFIPDSDRNVLGMLNDPLGVDAVEEDENFLSLVSTLQDLFPEFPLSEIKTRVRSTDDVDAIVSDLYLNRKVEFEDCDLEKFQYDEDPNKYSEDVYQLKEVFPDYDLDVLNLTYQAHYKDVQKTSEAILSGSVSKKASETIFDVEKYIGQNAEGELVSEDIANIKQLTCLTRKEVFLYLKKNHFNCIKTLIDIIENFYSRPAASNGIPRGGRVQRGGGASGKGRGTVVSGATNSYVYNAKSEEAKQLASFREGDQLLQNIQPSFFQKALVFYKGDYHKVIEVTIWIIEHEGLTYFMNQSSVAPNVPDKGKKPPAKANWKQFIQDIEQGKHKKVVLDSPAPLAAERYKIMSDMLKAKVQSASGGTNSINRKQYRSILNDADYYAMNERIETFYDSGQLDLHHLTVKSALSASLRCLEVWWQEELSMREIDGKFGNYNSNLAQFVRPMRIITGRGIHSVGGVSRIRQSVLSTLNKLGYIYNENLGSFEILGRR